MIADTQKSKPQIPSLPRAHQLLRCKPHMLIRGENGDLHKVIFEALVQSSTSDPEARQLSHPPHTQRTQQTQAD